MNKKSNLFPEISDDFCKLMEKTRSQLEELDPVEASVKQRDIFKKNLESLKAKKDHDSDNDDGDSGIVSSSGSWTLDNYKDRLLCMEREKSERQQMIEDYLLQQKQHNNSLDQVNNSEAEPEPMRLVAEDQQQLTTETNKSCHKINIVQCENIPIETISQTKDNQCFNYHALNQADIFEDYKESFSPTLSESLLIPEINLVAATPKENSPCISPKQVGKKDIKNEDENGMNKLDYTITDEDWDRMEAIAEQERLEDIETSQEEIDENRRKLNEFRQNPKVEISRSRLADELALILEEAKKRIEDDKGIKIKKNKKRPKEVTFKHPQSFDDSKAAPDTVKDMIKKVDKERINDIEDDGIEIDDSSLLNGFMDGFEDEDEDKGKELTVSKVNGKRKLMTKAGIACLVAFGAAILINKIRQ